MDPFANIKEQRELAQAIIAKFDAMEEPDNEIAYQAEELARLVLALDEWRSKGGFDPYANRQSFKTSDGYQLFLVGGKWVDSLDPDRQDLAFDADGAGHPIDDKGQRLEGRFQ